MHQVTKPDFKSLFESVPGLYLILSPDLTIVAASDAYLNATMTKRDEILGKGLFEVFPDNPDDPTATGVSNLHASLNSVLQNKTAHTMAVQKYDIRRPDGTFEERYWSPLNKPVLNENNEIAWIIHRVEDVTEFIRLKKEELKQLELAKDLQRQVEEMEMETYKRAQEIQLANKFLEHEVKERKKLEKYLEEFNERLEEQVKIKTDKLADEKNLLRSLIDNLPDFIYIKDRSSRYIIANKALFELVDADSEKEIIGKTVLDLFGHEIAPVNFEEDKMVFEKGEMILDREESIISKNGNRIWLLTSKVPLRDKNNKIIGLIGISRDITERKQTEEKINQMNEELRSLSAHLINIREEERARIAREIHDELGQQITGLKMDVSWLNKKLSSNGVVPVVKEKLIDIASLLDEAVHTVRKIASELRPSLLDDIGLVAALDWQSNEFRKRFDTPIHFTSQKEELKIDPAIATGLFRIYQETLTNVARHAHATKVESNLKIDDENIILTISDNGKGFDASNIKSRKTLGLLGMKERALIINGSLEIKSEPKKGTTVIISVPMYRK